MASVQIENDVTADSAPSAALQTTLAGSVDVQGIGFVTGADITLRLKPADADAGITFVRVDLPNRPQIRATIGNVVERRRRTALEANGATVELTEHVLAALAGMGIDNCTVELNGPETPGMDGSALPFVEAIVAAGSRQLDRPRRPLLITEPVCVSEDGAMVAVHPSSEGRFEITFNLDYGPGPAVGKQSLNLVVTPETFRNEIAPARTFVLEQEVEALRKQGLGVRTTAKDLIVFDQAGKPIDNELRFADECVRHKILDVIGDFALAGRPICGHVLAHKSGHPLNTKLVAQLVESERQTEGQRRPATRPLMDSRQIEDILPHRYPFLFVDRVLELDPNHRAVGIKNVSYNEPFFQGHWPGRPVMPGVLIVEAMAQLAGIMLTQWRERSQYAMIISIDNVKLRRPVVPGDQLLLEAHAVRVKSKTATLQASARIGAEPVAEARMNFVLVENSATLME